MHAASRCFAALCTSLAHCILLRCASASRVRRMPQLTDVVRECSIMLTLAAHPTVVRFHDLLRLPRYGDAFAIVMELVPGGELYSFIVQHGPLPERDARDVTRQLLDALRCVR